MVGSMLMLYGIGHDHDTLLCHGKIKMLFHELKLDFIRTLSCRRYCESITVS